MMTVKVSVIPTPLVEVPFVPEMTVADAFDNAGKSVGEGYKFKLDGIEVASTDVIEDNGREIAYLYATKMIKGNK